MDFKCVQDFVLMFCTCSGRLFQFSANMAAIMSQCRVFRRNVDFLGAILKNRLETVKIFLEGF